MSKTKYWVNVLAIYGVVLWQSLYTVGYDSWVDFTVKQLACLVFAVGGYFTLFEEAEEVK